MKFFFHLFQGDMAFNGVRVTFGNYLGLMDMQRKAVKLDQVSCGQCDQEGRVKISPCDQGEFHKTYIFTYFFSEIYIFTFFLSSRVLGLQRTPSHMAPFGGKGLLTHLCDPEAGYGGVWAPNFGGAAPGFKPRTSCMRVRSHSHYTTRGRPTN